MANMINAIKQAPPRTGPDIHALLGDEFEVLWRVDVEVDCAVVAVDDEEFESDEVELKVVEEGKLKVLDFEEGVARI